MKIVNFFKGANPYVTRSCTTYSAEDKRLAEDFVETYFGEMKKALGKRDYEGFCIDVEFNHVVGIVNLGELTEDTNTLRVWCHKVPVGKGILGGLKYETKYDTLPLSTKTAAELVYTCDQVRRYGVSSAKLREMSDFADIEGVA